LSWAAGGHHDQSWRAALCHPAWRADCSGRGRSGDTCQLCPDRVFDRDGARRGRFRFDRAGLRPVLILILMAALLVAGRLVGWPGRRGWAAVAALWLAAIAVLALMPQSALARLIGGDIRIWVLGGVVVALVLGYRLVLRHLHRRA